MSCLWIMDYYTKRVPVWWHIVTNQCPAPRPCLINNSLTTKTCLQLLHEHFLDFVKTDAVMLAPSVAVWPLGIFLFSKCTRVIRLESVFLFRCTSGQVFSLLNSKILIEKKMQCPTFLQLSLSTFKHCSQPKQQVKLCFPTNNGKNMSACLLFWLFLPSKQFSCEALCW